MSHFRFDCKNWEGYKPCAPQKEKVEVVCRYCRSYAPIRQNILIIEAGGLGSVLRVSVVAKELRARYPNAQIQWLTSDRNLELLANIPSVTRAYQSTWENLFILGAQTYDMVINFESDPLYLAFAKNLNAKQKFGFVMSEIGSLELASSLSEEFLRLQTQDDFRRKENRKSMQQILLEAVGLEWMDQDYDLAASIVDDQWARSFLKSIGVNPNDMVVALNIGSSLRHRAKRWPPRHFYELADICQKKRPDWKLLVVAGPEDVDVYMELLEMNRKKQLKNLIFSGFENSISQFISLIKLASLVVSSDTFGLHVALALNKWIVSLWGPQPKNETYSYGKEKKIDLGLDCAPCFAGTSNKCTNKQPLLCMEGIEANEVFQALEEVVFKM